MENAVGRPDRGTDSENGGTSAGLRKTNVGARLTKTTDGQGTASESVRGSVAAGNCKDARSDDERCKEAMVRFCESKSLPLEHALHIHEDRWNRLSEKQPDDGLILTHERRSRGRRLLIRERRVEHAERHGASFGRGSEPSQGAAVPASLGTDSAQREGKSEPSDSVSIAASEPEATHKHEAAPSESSSSSSPPPVGRSKPQHSSASSTDSPAQSRSDKPASKRTATSSAKKRRPRELGCLLQMEMKEMNTFDGWQDIKKGCILDGSEGDSAKRSSRRLRVKRKQPPDTITSNSESLHHGSSDNITKPATQPAKVSTSTPRQQSKVRHSKKNMNQHNKVTPVKTSATKTKPANTNRTETIPTKPRDTVEADPVVSTSPPAHKPNSNLLTKEGKVRKKPGPKSKSRAEKAKTKPAPQSGASVRKKPGPKPKKGKNRQGQQALPEPKKRRSSRRVVKPSSPSSQPSTDDEKPSIVVEPRASLTFDEVEAIGKGEPYSAEDDPAKKKHLRKKRNCICFHSEDGIKTIHTLIAVGADMFVESVAGKYRSMRRNGN